MNDKYTIKEISKLYNININTLYRNIQKNKIKTIPARKRGKKIQLIEKSEIITRAGKRKRWTSQAVKRRKRKYN